MSRITHATVHQHGGATLTNVLVVAIGAVLGANLQAGIDLHLKQVGADGKPDFIALEQDQPFNAAKFMQASQTEYNHTRVRIGWSDTPTIEGVRHWHKGSTDKAGLFGYDKGNDDKAGEFDPKWDEQLPGAKKYLILAGYPEDAEIAGNFALSLSAR